MNAILRIAAWILAIALVAMPVVAVLNGWIAGERWPMRHLVVTGEFRLVDDAQVRQAVLPLVQRGFFAVDLKQARARIAALPWVRSVDVRKRWPDRLEVVLSEYRPLAHWGADRMLSENGELFAAPKTIIAHLPRFDGADARAGDFLSFYSVAKPLFLADGQDITDIALSARGSWSLRLADGTEIEVGRSDSEARLGRFARLLPQLHREDPRRLMRADLRYTNGFAVLWQDLPAAPATAPNTATQVKT